MTKHSRRTPLPINRKQFNYKHKLKEKWGEIKNRYLYYITYNTNRTPTHTARPVSGIAMVRRPRGQMLMFPTGLTRTLYQFWSGFSKCYRREINPHYLKLTNERLFSCGGINYVINCLLDGSYVPAGSGLTPEMAGDAARPTSYTFDADAVGMVCKVCDLYVQYCLRNALGRCFKWWMPGSYDRPNPFTFKLGMGMHPIPQDYLAVVDLARFFARSDYSHIIDVIRAKTVDNSTHTVIKRYLQAGILKHGIARHCQDLPLSQLLANIMLAPLLTEMTVRGHRYFRSGDLLLIPANDSRNAFRISRSIVKYLKKRFKTDRAESLVYVHSQPKDGIFKLARGMLAAPEVAEEAFYYKFH